jgi:SAM-dependent methyltransferase
MTEDKVEDRLKRETDFHNERFGAEDARREDEFYFALDTGFEEYFCRIEAAAEGVDVLEYGCASGGHSIRLAPKVRSIVGIDISDVAVDQARRAAAQSCMANASFLVDNAEAMSFPDASFDLVFGSGILHHLDLPNAVAETRRVLRPGGRAIFWEPLGHNPAINLYRRMTPNARTADEHPLLRSDCTLLGRSFRSCRVTHYGLATLAAIPFRRSWVGKAVRAVGGQVDRLLLSLPGLRWQAWYVLIDLRA